MCDVMVFRTKAVKVASLRKRGPISEQPEAWQRLAGFVSSQGLTVTGPGVGIYYDTTWNPEDVNYEICLPVDKNGEAEGAITFRELASTLVASLIHRGSYDKMCESYKRLTEWIKANGYTIVGPPMEVYLRCPHLIDDAMGYVTDIQIPVAKQG